MMDSAKPLLLESAGAGHPLVVSFAFKHDVADHEDWFLRKRLAHVKSVTGRPFSTLFLKDTSNSWYTRGATGTSSVVETVRLIKSTARDLNASRLICTGASMGAYGAMLCGALAQAESILAFTPISFFNLEQASEFQDFRYASYMESAACVTPVGRPELDLAKVAQPQLSKIKLVYGSMPGSEHVDNASHDAVHAWRIKAHWSSVELHCVPQADHFVAMHLARRGLMDSLVIPAVFG